MKTLSLVHFFQGTLPHLTKHALVANVLALRLQTGVNSVIQALTVAKWHSLSYDV